MATATVTRKPDPCTVIVFGAAGDLSYRKLMPSLFHLYRGEHISEKMIFIGVDRVEMTEDAFREKVKRGQTRALGLQTMMLPKPKDWDQFLTRLHYFQGDVGDEKSMSDLAALVEKLEKENGLGRRRVLYLSLPLGVFTKGIKALEAANLIGKSTRKEGEWSRVIIEKPFGRDLESAQSLRTLTHEVLDEREIYRIDHFLGKETIQNILFFRFANAMYEPLWNHKYIDHVQITASDPLGLEGGAGYYEETGCMRDMVQNHMMQVLTLVAMEPPVSFEAEAIRDEKVKALRALRPIAPADAIKETVRGQYLAGKIGRNEVPGFRQEEGANPASTTESYLAMRVFIDNWRWAGTPFYIRAGKRMAKPSTEICIFFKKIPHVLFKDMPAPPQPNCLILQIQPNDGVAIQFEVKVPGSENKVKTTQMHFRYPEAFVAENPSAYERLLQDCMLGDQTLFIRSDEVDASWRLVTSVLQGWKDAPPPKFPNYKAGTWGPVEADEWMKEQGRAWHNA